ncbi:DNA polymerase III subunit delta' [Amphibiibacter pelophylacis]|uniref:DNA polymerase III subunit delta n=1 Tax=Amphibiibacter pelophylacis TaxID=1799477 RepID=A0ACC6P3X5_9BURK
MSTPQLAARWLHEADAGLPWLADPVRDWLDNWRGHAALVCGAPGAGQLPAAAAWAKAWLCDSAAAARQRGEPSPLACGQCQPCRWFAARQHPDVCWVSSEAQAQAWELANAGEAVDEAKPAAAGKKPRKPSAELRVVAVRAAIAWAQRPPQHSPRRVMVLSPAQAMNDISANALLKTLEEPIGETRLLLCVDDPGRLLPTVRSRCQRLDLPPVLPDQVLPWLSGHIGGDAPVLLAAAGTALRALELYAQGISAAAWQRLPARALQGEAPALADWPLPVLLASLIKLVHDLQCAHLGGTPQFFPADALAVWSTDLNDLDARRPGEALATLARWGQRLTALVRHEGHAWNAAILLPALLQWRLAA